jgi:membrane peptidoglycan carboxypeptidase
MGGGSGRTQPPASFPPTGAPAGRGAPPAAGRAAPAAAGRAAPPAAAPGGRRAAAANGRGKKPSGRIIDYPRWGKTGFRRWIPSWRLLLGLFATGLAAVLIVVVAWYSSVQIPEPSDFADFQTTTVYYADGTTPMGSFAEQNRVIVDGDTIPEHVRQAVVAAEDRTFYENPGINPVGIARALWQNLRGGNQQGGSSITQQYAERYYSDQTITDYAGKIREAMLAVKLTRSQDKDEILANYLNTIYFGRDSYGIETAAQAYFNVGVADLDISQAALLAGVIPSPNNFDPRVSQEQAERRWNYVLDGMVETGALTQSQRDAQVFPEVIEFARSDTYAGPQGYLLDMVRREITSRSAVTDEELDHAGFRIVTTIDPALQQMAVAAIDVIPADKPANLRTALVTLDRETGAILALYGGPDFLTISRNAVTQDQAQAGSTFKPFALVAYLESGGSLKSRYVGNSGMAVEGFPDGVRNFGNQSFGEIDVVQATANSVNAVYAQMNVEVGPATTLQVAREAGVCASGVTTDGDCPVLDGQEVPANVLGTASPNPIDMAQAYNTFADQGLRTEPFIVQTVEYLDGRLVYEGANDPVRVFAADVMADTTYALTQVVQRGTARDARAVGHPVAGKTGTSNENKSAWFIGYTMHMTTAVAMYQVGEDAEGRAITEPITPFGGVRQVTGGSHPLDVWTAFMTPAHAALEVLPFPPPADVGEPNTPPLTVVPSVVGTPEADAVAALEAAGFVAAVNRANDPEIAPGTVISQAPAGGGEAEMGSTVAITVSDGPGDVTVPDVVGSAEEAARDELEQAGFSVTVEQASDPDVQVGKVISQSVTGEAPPGTTVTIVVSTGPAPDPPPDEGGG